MAFVSILSPCSLETGAPTLPLGRFTFGLFRAIAGVIGVLASYAFIGISKDHELIGFRGKQYVELKAGMSYSTVSAPPWDSPWGTSSSMATHSHDDSAVRGVVTPLLKIGIDRFYDTDDHERLSATPS